jgi:hypothetical protein
MESPYKKNLNELDEKEKKDVLAVYAATNELLAKGDRLYGVDSDDVSHIEYAISVVLQELKLVFKEGSLNTFVEIGIDSSGYFISCLRKPVE